MSENCTHNCETCGESCPSREGGFPKEQLKEGCSVKKVIGIVSGKGGVGKSMVTSLLSVILNRRGYHTAILDADVTGPSIPKAFGLHGRAQGTEMGILPVKSKLGTDIMSVNLLLGNETDPVVWRGPVIAGAVKQFWTDVLWNDVDYMFVDMPPGTGDVPLTVFQSLPVDGIIIVTSPQELVSMIVTKAVHMAQMMSIPVLGLIENYSYYQCPDCGAKHAIFGESHLEQEAMQLGLPLLAQLPIDPELAAAIDVGNYSERKLRKNPWLMNPHQIYIANDIAYVVARHGDTFQDLGKELGISWKKLVKYNDLHREYTLMEGDIIYLKSKKKKASKPHTVYVVRDGDSMHGISQKYGIRLKNLYKMNRKDGDYVPEVGDRLRLR